MTSKLRIKEIRELRGLTQQELADMIGCSGGHLSMLERGKKRVNYDHLNRLSNALQVDPHELIGGPAGERLQRLAKFEAILSDEDFARLEAFAAALAESSPEK